MDTSEPELFDVKCNPEQSKYVASIRLTKSILDALLSGDHATISFGKDKSVKLTVDGDTHSVINDIEVKKHQCFVEDGDTFYGVGDIKDKLRLQQLLTKDMRDKVRTTTILYDQKKKQKKTEEIDILSGGVKRKPRKGTNATALSKMLNSNSRSLNRPPSKTGQFKQILNETKKAKTIAKKERKVKQAPAIMALGQKPPRKPKQQPKAEAEADRKSLAPPVAKSEPDPVVKNVKAQQDIGAQQIPVSVPKNVKAQQDIGAQQIPVSVPKNVKAQQDIGAQQIPVSVPEQPQTSLKRKSADNANSSAKKKRKASASYPPKAAPKIPPKIPPPPPPHHRQKPVVSEKPLDLTVEDIEFTEPPSFSKSMFTETYGEISTPDQFIQYEKDFNKIFPYYNNIYLTLKKMNSNLKT